MRLKTLAIALIPFAESCGVAVHSYLVERILPFLPSHIIENEAFVRAGAFYPDAFYNCMGEYDAAEDAHWPPFLASGVELVKARRAAGDKNTAQLEAFLVGILTHQVSDISWHSLGIFEGLLRAMAEREFDGDYDDAHTVLDVGGDMVQLHRLSSDPEHSKWLSKGWDYNPADIQELLRINGYTDIAQSSIRYCMTRGKAALSAELNVADVGFKRFARRSPLMFDQLETYYAGGETDMQQQIEECMPKFLQWLNGSAYESPWDLCQVFDGKRPRRDNNELYPRNEKALFSVEGILEVLKDVKSSIKTRLKPQLVTSLNCDIVSVPALQSDETTSFGNGTYRPEFGAATVWWNGQWAVGAPIEGKVYVYNETFDHIQTIKAKAPNKHIGKYATQFGASMAVWDKYLVVASPGISALHLYNRKGEWSGSITWKDATHIYGHRGIKLVGQSLAVDTDLGILYVGAPFYDDMKLEEPDQVGAVYALPRSVLRKASLGNVVKLEKEEHLMVKGEKPYERLGTQLAVTPRFILVGSPGEAKVHGFDFATHKKILTLDSPVAAEAKLSGFGGYLLTGDKDYVVIGAPASSESSGSSSQTQAGGVIIYKNTQMQNIAGGAEFEWLGYNGIEASINHQNSILLASPHAAEGHGILWRLDLHTQQLSTLGSPPASAGSGFGRSIAKNDSVVVIGMPFYQQNGPRLGAIAVIPI